MIPQSLSSLWGWLAPAAANHLWQSTVFALGAEALTLLLRKNQARVRYWLWLAASIKFLVPFALLMALGSFLAPARAPAGTPSGYSYAIEISQPFSQLTPPVIAPSSVHHLNFAALLPTTMLLLWLVGFVAVLTSWFLRWRRIRAAVRRAVPVDTGREVEVLRRLERASGIRRPVCLWLSMEGLEPGVFGIFRPVLLWPAGISAHLNDAHLEAILAHELQHVRCRDNLAAALHAFVQAVFWFHPLVWWMGAQMVRERERGCDEKVVEIRSPGVYAEGILKTCEFCIASPLASFSGVTGADLKQRIVRIMSGGDLRKLDFRRKLLLAVAGVIAVALPITFGLLYATQSRAQTAPDTLAPAPPPKLMAANADPSFEVATIKPSKPGKPGFLQALGTRGRTFETVNSSLGDLISFAYQVQAGQIVNAPAWLNSDRYDISAIPDQPGEPNPEQMRIMLRKLLTSRFKLSFHNEKRDLSAYVLTIVKNGEKLKPTQMKEPLPRISMRPGAGGLMILVQDATMGDFSAFMRGLVLDRPMVDQTGLTGRYDFKFTFTPDDSQFNGHSPLPPQTSTADSAPNLFEALQQQLGLKLESRKTPVEVIAIDHVEHPSPN